MKKQFLIYALLIVIFLSGCVSYRPIIKYSPIELYYGKHPHASVDEIAMYMRGNLIPHDYDAIGSAYVPLKVVKAYSPVGIYMGEELKEITQEEAIKALQEEAWKRGADAVIDINYTTEEKEVPASGLISPYGGGFRGSGKIVAEFMCGTIIIWKK
jgi:hypothetical protein